jgi:tetratricopeptide (TPR) repeat protein
LEYVKILLWPSGLTASHGQYVANPWEHPAPWIGAALLAAWIGTAAFLAWPRRQDRFRSPRTALALAWMVATLAPHLGVLPLDTFVAERFLYLPLAGIAALIGLAFDYFRRERLGAAAILALPLLSFGRTGDWRDETRLWTAAARTEPGNAFARFALAEALYAEGRTAESAQAVREGLALNPSAPLAYAGLNNLSEAALKEGRPGAALRFAEKALRVRPDGPEALFNRRAASAALEARGKR